MRILLDARTVGREFSGVGNYVQELVRAFSRLDADLEVHLLVRGESRLRELDLDARFVFVDAPFSHESHPLGDLWEEWVLPRRARRARIDVLHGPAFLVPAGIREPATVVTIHDLVAFTHPETIPFKYALYMRWLIRRTARGATRVITDSEAVREDVVARFRVPADRVETIPLGVADRFRAPSEARLRETRARLGLERPYLLFVGNLEPRKNLPALLEAYRTLRTDGAAVPDLAVCGKIAWKSEGLARELAAEELHGSVHATGWVEPEDLPALYAGAEAFVFPSRWEGFGLPVLEAMACGTPVVASRIASLIDVAGEAAEWVDPDSADSIAEGIRRVLRDGERRAELVRLGSERAAAFPWERTAQRTLDAYRRARGKP